LIDNPDTPTAEKDVLKRIGPQNLAEFAMAKYEMEYTPRKYSAALNEFLDAQAQGYTGSFIDYKDKYGLTMVEKLLMQSSGNFPQITIPTYATEAEAKQAGLQPGQLFKDLDGKKYRVN